MMLDEIQDPDDDTPVDIRPFAVPADMAGARLDKVLAACLPDLSRTRLKSLILAGAVMQGETPLTDPAQKVPAFLSGHVLVPALIEADPVPEKIPLDIVHEDDDLLVINKAADMVVHPAIGHSSGTLVHALLYHCGATLSGIGGVKRPGIVHRLDRGTSGLMLVAKHDHAHTALQAQLSDRTLGRVYHAVTFKVPIPPIGTIDRPIGRSPRDRLKMTIGGVAARSAITHYRVLDSWHDLAALTECRLETGRTHQIRVHLSAAGYPLIGDPLYGPQETALRAAMTRAGVDPAAAAFILSFPRQALHAAEIHFIHPRTRENMSFTAPAPADFLGLIKALSGK